MIVKKGITTTVRLQFTARGRARPQFVVPPRWTLLTSLDEVLVQGVAVQDSDGWVAQVTVPSTYTPIGPGEALTLEATGRDATNTNLISNTEITLADTGTSNWQPDVVLYNRLIDEDLTTTLVSPVALQSWSAKFVDPAGTVVSSTENTAPESTGTEAGGYTYPINAGQPPLANYVYSDPYQLIIRTVDENGRVDSQSQVVYVLSPAMTPLINSLRMYLDKTRFRDIDPSLDWHLSELVHFVFEGIKYVNAAPPMATFWTADRFPSSLQPHLIAAAALRALQSRHLAEGLNAFQFQGSQSSLEFNRTEALQSHIDMMQSTLETLPAAKAAAVRVFGQGTTPPGVVSQRIANIGTVSVTSNLVNRGRFLGRGGPIFR